MKHSVSSMLLIVLIILSNTQIQTSEAEVGSGVLGGLVTTLGKFVVNTPLLGVSFVTGGLGITTTTAVSIAYADEESLWKMVNGDGQVKSGLRKGAAFFGSEAEKKLLKKLPTEQIVIYFLCKYKPMILAAGILSCGISYGSYCLTI